MSAIHLAFVEDRIVTAIDNHGQSYVTAESRYRWVCSTCKRHGSWTPRRSDAISAASRHEAKPGKRG
jgi:hypothetical protein